MPDSSEDLRPTVQTSGAARPGVPLAALFLLAGFAAILITLVLPQSAWHVTQMKAPDMHAALAFLGIGGLLGAAIGAGIGLLRDRSFARGGLGMIAGGVVGGVAAMSLITKIEPGPALIGCAVLVLGAACVRVFSGKSHA